MNTFTDPKQRKGEESEMLGVERDEIIKFINLNWKELVVRGNSRSATPLKRLKRGLTISLS